ncbi:Hypothetical protein R9X50_00723500 [Acrodontium crateriforme]|uniref:WW domain-containing protein n=1 Tax=Acrodontium crateriforme TaxID=150365 RepID=A0AAQ3MAP5_9PEZI|nr:Hypothetical protein R9X50_00723500 [Acrodontium crateriforme]
MSNHQDVPSEPPPAYHEVASSSSSRPQAASNTHNRLDIPRANDQDIPYASRRSMEDEHRPLPQGWVRSFDPGSEHQFFVDTTKTPPRSIWVHPYDDEQYLSTLSSEERERIEQESLGRGYPPSKADVIAAHSDEDDDRPARKASGAELPPRPQKEKLSFGRKMKDKITGTTHEQRERERKQRAEEERQLYQRHLAIRQAMTRAAQTGQPQLIGKDRDGKDVYVEPPAYRGDYGGYGNGAYGVNPYGGGMYAPPSARYQRPMGMYRRPYGGGYGGGYGMPLALGVGGGLMGGMLLGDMLGGGFGGGFC